MSRHTIDMQTPDKINELQEMFPFHSRKLIECELKSHNGNMENTITTLLKIQPDTKKVNHPQVISIPEHILPPDFLVWPTDAPAVMINEDGTEKVVCGVNVFHPELEIKVGHIKLDPSLFNQKINPKLRPKHQWANFKKQFSN